MFQRRYVLATIVALALLPLLPLPSFWFEQANYMGLYSLVVIGLVLLTGVAGLTSFGQAPFVGIAAYATAWLCLRIDLSPWLTLPICLVVTAGFAWILAAVTLRMSGHYLPLATIAWSVALFYLFGSTEALGKYDGLAGISPVSFFGYALLDGRSMFWLIWTFVLVTLWLCSNLLDSQPGRAMRALRGGTRMPEAMGVDTWRLKVVIFVLAAVAAALSGWLFAHMQRAVSPAAFGLNASLEYVIMLVIGGMAHLGGAVVGAVIVKLLQDQLKVLLPAFFGDSGHAEVIVFGVILLLCLRFAPQGLWPAFRRLLPTRTKSIPEEAAPLAKRTSPVAGAPLLEVENLRKTFGGLVAVSGVGLRVDAGEIVGLIGPNGAGKSTTFNMITGQLSPSAGKILFQGRSVAGVRASGIAALGISRTFQHVKLVPDMTVVENVALGAYLRSGTGVTRAMLRLDRKVEGSLMKEAARAVHRVGLGDFLHHPAGSLALGQQRLVEIARALCSDPLLLLLDEPAAGLRAFEKRALADLLDQLRAEGMAILLVEHDMEFVMELTDHIVVMVFGTKIAEGSPEAIQSNQAVLDAYLGAPE